MAAQGRHQPSGMRAFTFIWVGQFLSLLGSGATRFAVTLWAWEMTGRATDLTLLAFFGFAPLIIMTPIAGALVDRWRNRKLVMMLSDLAAGLVTIFYLIMALSGGLQIWHLYVGAIVAGVFESFQFPAYSAAISTMVDKKHYGRTSAMMSLAEAASGIFAPIAGATLYALVKIEGVLLLDVITFLFAVGALMLVYIPETEPSKAGDEGKGSLLQEAAYGFRYIVKRPSLLGLQLMFFVGNFLASFAGVLSSPMVLARTGNDEFSLAALNIAFSVGGIVGGVAMSAWGGPRARVWGVLVGWMLSALFGQVLLGAGQVLPVWIAAAFASSFFIPVVNASNQAIWMAKVPPQLQGRVFSARRLIAQVTSPIAILIAGPLSDYVFEPMMRDGTGLGAVFAPIVGTGTGAGMGLLIFLTGVLLVGASLIAMTSAAVRNVEALIPDHGQDAVAPPAASASSDSPVDVVPAPAD